MEKTSFTISVIIPVYNVEDYIRETIESVIGQTIGFRDNIQLVLVNDGSTDGSAEICKEYKRQYPDNVVYLEKENGGVSSARNLGMKYAEGRYINFLDSDDTWEASAFEEFIKFFKNNPDVRVATGRFMFTGARRTKHHLDYKYNKTGVVNILEKHKFPEMSVAKTFIEKELTDGHVFNESVEIAEDSLFLNKLILKEGKYGVIREAEYYYRKRDDHTSALDNSIEKLSWYTVTPKAVYLELIDYCKKLHGEVIPYLQYLLLTDIQWRTGKKIPETLPQKAADEYIDTLKKILQGISDELIIDHKTIGTGEKTYILELKHGGNVFEEDKSLSMRMLRESKISIDIISVEENLVIRGIAAEKYISEAAALIVRDNSGHEYKAEYSESPVYNKSGVQPSVIKKGYTYTVRLPLRDHVRYSFYFSDTFGNKCRMKVTPGKFSRLTRIENTFFCTDKYIVKLIKNRLCIYDYRVRTYLASSFRYNKELKKRADKETLLLRKKGIRERQKAKKPIWLISDRTDLAGDNGEALFTYLMNSEYKDKYDIYFVIESKSKDYDRLKGIGKVLAFGTEEHLVKQMAASVVASSAGEDRVFNPFGKKFKYFKDILDYKYIFLQHGITKDDLSGWLHALKKNVSIFVTAANAEYRSIINGNYGYGEDVVKLTGFARFDKLKNDPKKTVAIIPTWRQDIAARLVPGTSRRRYIDTFKDSDYFKFYNKLINDKRLNDALARTGYRGIFYLHPSFKEQARDFTDGSHVSVWRDKIDYSKVFRESALMVTDYSSVAMDFAYLKKPVIYTQFDREHFFMSHSYKEGYFNYETDGFGPVVYDYDSTISAIIAAIEGDCAESEEYLERIDSFYAFTDTDNCSRIVQEIEKKIKGRG